MSATTEPFGGSFLTHDVRPEDIVTREDLGEEERMLIQALEDFAERQVAPHMDELDQGNAEVGRRLFQAAAELGVFMVEVPEEYGGLDLNVLAITGMCSVRSKLGSLASFVFTHQGIGMLPLVNFATEEQRTRYLEPCMSGEMLSAFALTEPGTGSDAMNITTRALLNDAGTHYVLNGAKQWITNAGHADIFIVFAKVDGERFTAFIMDRGSPGLSIGANERLLGQHGTSVAALQLEDVAIPVENLLGEVGKGHKVAFCTLNVGRLKLATYAAGGAVGAVEVASKYAAERVQFGQRIGDFGMIQRKLSDMAARAYMAEAVAYRAAGLVYHALESRGGEGRPSLDDKLAMLSEFSAECAMAKVLASESYNHLADEAIQVFGGYGYSEEYAPAHMYRDSRITRIYEGTNEICRLYASRALIKRAWKGTLDFDAARATPRPGVAAAGTDFGQLHERVADLKQAYLYLVGVVDERVDRERLFDPDNQQLVASLADVAIEIFGAESTVLRAEKAVAAGVDPTALVQSLARIAFARAADRVRQEANEVLAALSTPDELPARLADIAAWMPLPAALIGPRTLVAEALLERGGLPTGDLQPV